MQQNIAIGIVHGRFQPPHNGHIRYILGALEHAEHVIVGICTPDICTQEFADRTGYPCTQELNPYTYDERVHMICDTLDELNIARNRYTCIPFPSDYKNINAIVPTHAVFLVSHTGDNDSKKIAYLENLGYKTKTILNTRHEDEASGQYIRTSIAQKGNEWKKYVPTAVRKYIENKI